MTSPQTNGRGNGSKSSAARWPDLLIGLLVLLLLGGFGFLLFGQRSGNTGTTANTPSPTTPAESVPAPAETAEIPAAPGAVVTPPETTTAAPTQTPAETPAEIAPVTGQTPEQTQTPAVPETAAPETTTTPAATAPTAATPATPGAAATEATTSLGDIPTIVAAPVEAVPTETPTTATPAAPATTDPVAPAARTGGAVATSETRTPLRSDYRISLGSFSSEATATSRTAGVSGLGYRVYPIDLGSEVVAQIGPFADEATARQALADIVRAYPGAILYPPRNRTLTGGSGSGTSPTSGSTAPNTATESAAPNVTAPAATPPAATPAPQAAAPDGPVYLQVGAFDRVEGAQNLVGTLRDQGFAPTVNAPEGRKVTVLVGPFSGDALIRAEERLSSSGLDSFRVR
ncbi:SPOR domain-containing protein [Deinococcus aquatilis]|jgi:cell division septation protein DedD|uniref:SPOR domain-containing protein n=1 Tax=Deinococcus aquatilis TaxID=519440 RepID=UPI0003AA198B|nr:SPOR domain-containing protein [Deinococcus aquatilis]